MEQDLMVRCFHLIQLWTAVSMLWKAWKNSIVFYMFRVRALHREFSFSWLGVLPI